MIEISGFTPAAGPGRARTIEKTAARLPSLGSHRPGHRPGLPGLPGSRLGAREDKTGQDRDSGSSALNSL